MAVVKIDSELKQKVLDFIKENHINYPSIKTFVDISVNEKLKKCSR